MFSVLRKILEKENAFFYLKIHNSFDFSYFKNLEFYS